VLRNTSPPALRRNVSRAHGSIMAAGSDSA